MPKKQSADGRLTNQQKHDLDVEIGFVEGLVRRDPEYVDALRLLGDDYTRRGRINDGLKVDEQLARLRPEDPLVHYNLACSYALAEQFEEAVFSLDRAICLGYRDFRWLSRDPDLRKLRRHPLYRRIRERVKSVTVKIR